MNWAYGVGQVGCLFNHSEVVGTLDRCLDLAAEMYDLTNDQKNDLRWHKIVYFEGEQREMNGDYIELYETDRSPEDE